MGKRPTWDEARRATMAPTTPREREIMLWAFRGGVDRTRELLRLTGFQFQAICGVLGDEALAQRCIPVLHPEAPDA